MPFARRIAACALLVLSFSVAHATCPPQHEPAGERRFDVSGTPYLVQLCLKTPGDAGTAGKLVVMAFKGDQPAAQATLPVDVEGEIRAVRFDTADYPIAPKMPAIPVHIEARLRGASFDQYSTDLWLLMFDGQAIQQVLAQNVSWESWGTQCDTDCIDTTKTRTIVVIAPETSARGFHDLRLRTRGKVTPPGKPEAAANNVDKTTRFVFNGQAYVEK